MPREQGPLRFESDDLGRSVVRELVAGHLADMFATSPAESVHALDLDALRAPRVTFRTVWDGAELVGCGALAELTTEHGELKSMRTVASARGRGVGAATLAHLLELARARGYRRVSLETGTQPFFAPARRLYQRAGFRPCGPFADYVQDPSSAFYTLRL